MERIFIFAIVIMAVIFLTTFIFILQMRIGLGKNIKELKSGLDKVSEGVPFYSPMGLSTAIARIFLSFISLFFPSS